jgi:hypothetical protein
MPDEPRSLEVPSLEVKETMKINRNLMLIFTAGFFLFGFAACSSTVNPDSPFSLVDDTGRHPEGWIGDHRMAAVPDGSLCVDCHGEDLDGGITGISCATGSLDGTACHSGGPAFHPADWLNRSASGDTWHADAWRGNLIIRGLSCEDCHTPPDLNDPDGGKCLLCHFTMGGSYSPGGWPHGMSDHGDYAGSAEQSVCVNCHEINTDFGHQDSCHNCHEIHPDPDWDERSHHGAAAKQAPGTMTGFETCASCHGEGFEGDGSAISCLGTAGCHLVEAPHPAGDRWEEEGIPTHTNTSQDNAPSCGLCHLGDPEPPVFSPLPPGADPGCYNNTLCHGYED